MKCHAAATHPVAADRGAFGELCSECYEAVLKLLKKRSPVAFLPN